VRDEKVKVLRAIPEIKATDLVRGQFRGYLEEQGVAAGSTVETFAALRLAIDNWRWQGVPFFIRAGKSLPVTCTEVIVHLRRPPLLFGSQSDRDYFRLRISPLNEVAIGVNVMDPAEAGVGQAAELLAHQAPGLNERDAYERVLTDAMMGDRTLFAREDYVEEAWRIVDPVLKAGTPAHPYAPGTWGPKEAEAVAPAEGWHNPLVANEAG
jgi:glucose-6-phosphate 1-dehydrogenase